MGVEGRVVQVIEAGEGGDGGSGVADIAVGVVVGVEESAGFAGPFWDRRRRRR